VDLGREVPVEKIVVWNRTDGNLGSRLANFTLLVKDADKKTVFESLKNPAPKEKAEIKVGGGTPFRTLRKAAMFALVTVRGQEADAFKSLAKLLTEEADRGAAVQALLRINQRDWPKDDAKAYLDTVMKYIRSLPVTERTTTTALDFMQLGEGLAGLLKPEEAKAARKELADIGVRVIRVGTLFDQMSFDKERMVVQAGKPVEVRVREHGHHAAQLRDRDARQPRKDRQRGRSVRPRIGRGRGAVRPQHARYRAPQEQAVADAAERAVEVTAPKEPGIYPYVCTYPGHWRRMHGALYVVADLEAYQENPEEYLAKNPLTVKDDLLKFNRPRTEWKLEELTDAVKEMETKGGRSFANGKQMFTVATCVACHKFGGQGNEFGPDLMLLNKDQKTFKSAVDVLDHILEPSKKIDDKYAVYRIETTAMKIYTAMIVEEKDGIVKIIENPLLSAKPIELKASDIAERVKAKNSIMSKGLLDKLSREEILDLLAYVWGRADPKSKLFEGGHGH